MELGKQQNNKVFWGYALRQCRRCGEAHTCLRSNPFWHWCPHSRPRLPDSRKGTSSAWKLKPSTGNLRSAVCIAMSLLIFLLTQLTLLAQISDPSTGCRLFQLKWERNPALILHYVSPFPSFFPRNLRFVILNLFYFCLENYFDSKIITYRLSRWLLIC